MKLVNFYSTFGAGVRCAPLTSSLVSLALSRAARQAVTLSLRLKGQCARVEKPSKNLTNQQTCVAHRLAEIGFMFTPNLNQSESLTVRFSESSLHFSQYRITALMVLI